MFDLWWLWLACVIDACYGVSGEEVEHWFWVGTEEHWHLCVWVLSVVQSEWQSNVSVKIRAMFCDKFGG